MTFVAFTPTVAWNAQIISRLSETAVTALFILPEFEINHLLTAN